MIGVSGHRPQDALLDLFSWRLVIAIGVIGAVTVVLLWIPVLGDKLMAITSARAWQVGRIGFAIGIVMLIAGVIVHNGLLVAFGALLAGGTLLGWIAMNY